MLSPGYLPLTADRYTPFSVTLNFSGLNLAGYTLHAQVRPTPNDTSTPLADLPTVTVANTIGFRLLASGLNVNGVPFSTVSMYIDETTIRGMAAASGLTGTQLTDDSDLTFSWDLDITDTSGLKQMYINGPFILRAGTTQ